MKATSAAFVYFIARAPLWEMLLALVVGTVCGSVLFCVILWSIHKGGASNQPKPKTANEIDTELSDKQTGKPYDKVGLVFGLIEIGILIIFVAVLMRNPSAVPLVDIYNKKSHQRIVTYLILANVPHWQPTYKLRTDELAIVTVPMHSVLTNGAWGTSPSLGDCDAGGYSNTIAGNKFEYPGAPEGCLIIKYGETNFDYWTNSNESKSFTNAGTIYFMANDEMNGSGLYFGDNRGKIEVTIMIAKSIQLSAAPAVDQSPKANR